VAVPFIGSVVLLAPPKAMPGFVVAPNPPPVLAPAVPNKPPPVEPEVVAAGAPKAGFAANIPPEVPVLPEPNPEVAVLLPNPNPVDVFVVAGLLLDPKRPPLAGAAPKAGLAAAPKAELVFWPKPESEKGQQLIPRI